MNISLIFSPNLHWLRIFFAFAFFGRKNQCVFPRRSYLMQSQRRPLEEPMRFAPFSSFPWRETAVAWWRFPPCFDRTFRTHISPFSSLSAKIRGETPHSLFSLLDIYRECGMYNPPPQTPSKLFYLISRDPKEGKLNTFFIPFFFLKHFCSSRSSPTKNHTRNTPFSPSIFILFSLPKCTTAAGTHSLPLWVLSSNWRPFLFPICLPPSPSVRRRRRARMIFPFSSLSLPLSPFSAWLLSAYGEGF